MSMEPRGLTPKQLVLQLLSAAREQSIPIRGLLRAGEILGLSPNHIRVTCTRLKSQGLIDSSTRGSYILGDRARSIQHEVSAWREIESRLDIWDGSWLAVHTAGLGKGERREWRHRRRILRLLGFRELVTGLEIRPRNLKGGVLGTRRRLHRLGLDPDAPVFRLTHLGEVLENKVPELWKVRELNQGYAERREELIRLRDKVEGMAFERAAREVFFAGNEAIRDLVFDPLLPEPIVDTDLRRALLKTTIAFDELGHRLWARVLEIEAEPVAEMVAVTASAGAHPVDGILGEWYG